VERKKKDRGDKVQRELEWIGRRGGETSLNVRGRCGSGIGWRNSWKGKIDNGLKSPGAQSKEREHKKKLFTVTQKAI